MGFLNPLVLLAALAVAVPVLLHLFHRHRSRRLPFPALRYLRRTEREHARRIKLRQILLLLVRSAVVLLLVAAGARMFVVGRSDTHDPTALAIVLDNSLSSSRVTGEGRVLDRLKDVALATLERAGPEDRIWVIRVGEPWDVAVPGDAEAARQRVEATGASDAAGDLSAALSRARGLVEAAGLAAEEIHLLSDLQASALAGLEPDAVGDVPVVAWHPDRDDAANRFISDVVIGGGLPPLAGQRTDIAVTLGPGPDTAVAPVRLVLDGRIRAASGGRPGEVVVLPVGPFQVGEVTGWVETDPDDLGADDRRYLTFPVRPPVRVARTGPDHFFLDQALQVLAEGGRARLGPADSAEVLFAVHGDGADRREGRVLVVVPPADPNVLPALNRRLASAGIPWSYEPPSGTGEVGAGENRLSVDFEELRVRRHYGLVPATASPPTADIPIRLETGGPFLVSGRDARGTFLLLATPLDPEWTTLPLDAGMLPFLEWTTSRRSGSDAGGRSVLAGEPISLGPDVAVVEAPDGTRHPVDGTQSFRQTRDAGLYRVLRGDTLVERVAVNPPPSESLLDPASEDDLERRIGQGLVRAGDLPAWRRAIFTDRQGPELWWPLLLAALLLLLAESWIAAPGAAGSRGGGGSRKESTERRKRAERQEPDQVGAPIS